LDTPIDQFYLKVSPEFKEFKNKDLIEITMGHFFIIK
jgi:hypothetical protein